jgi:DNA polymerase-3 subunit chi
MRVDFYQLGSEPVEAVLPQLARSARNAGARMVVVSEDADQRQRIDAALWERLPGEFLAHGAAGEKHAARQPVLLADACTAENQAKFVALADGRWRDEAFGFERAFLLFGEAELDGARACWRMLDGREGAERHFWKREDGKWVEGP